MRTDPKKTRAKKLKRTTPTPTDAQPERPPTSELRRRAEARVQRSARPKDLLALSQAGALHELHVHQIELQAQHEALLEARSDSDAALERYTEIFDFAPIGYVVLAADETVQEINQTGARILGLDRKRLAGEPLVSFVVAEDRTIFGSLLGRAVDSDTRETCELTLRTNAGVIAAQLTVRALTTGRRRFLLAMEDVTERKDREERLRRAECLFTAARGACGGSAWPIRGAR